MKKRSILWAFVIMLASGAIAQNGKEKTNEKTKIDRPIPCRSPHYDPYTGYFRNDILDSTQVEKAACDNVKLERYKNK